MRNINILIVLSVLCIFMAPVSGENAPSLYIIPVDSTISCGGNETIEIRMNTTDTSFGAQAYAVYNSSCVNITNVDYTGSPWQPGFGLPGWKDLGDMTTMATLNFAPGVVAGDHLFATITVEAVGCNCSSDIAFTTVRPDGTIVYNGTATSGSSSDPVPPIPEMSTFLLVSVGVIGLLLVFRSRL